MLIIVYFLLQLPQNATKVPFVLILLSGFLIMITRTEGILFIALFLIASLLLDIPFKTRSRLISVFGAFVLLYNLALFFYLSAITTAFWSPSKALLSVGSIIAALAATLLFEKLLPRFFHSQNFKFPLFLIFLFLFCIAGFLIANREVYFANLNTIFIHITRSTLFPTVLFLTCLFPFLFIRPGNAQKFSIFLLFAYPILTFSIFLFRARDWVPNLLHTSMANSGRRVFLQALPFAVMLLCLNVKKTLGLTEDNSK